MNNVGESCVSDVTSGIWYHVVSSLEGQGGWAVIESSDER
jgi:hypothetical protein